MTDLAFQSVLPRSAIADGFGRGARSYEAKAEVQRFAAAELTSYLESLRDQIPAGPILEVGCGTGFVTRHLSRLFPDREMVVTDLSPEMLDQCRSTLSGHQGEVSFQAVDAEEVDSTQRFSLIAAGFVAQWFRDPAGGLVRLATLLRPGGVLIASLPGKGSFPEWKGACLEAGIEYPGIELPESRALREEIARGGMGLDLITSSYTERYESPLHFFRHLRKIGAAPPIREERLPLSKMRALLKALEEPSGMTSATYELTYLFIRSGSGAGESGAIPTRFA